MRPTSLLPVGTLSAKRVVGKIIRQVGLAKLRIEIALPGFLYRGVAVIDDSRTMNPIHRAKRQMSAWIERDTLPWVNARPSGQRCIGFTHCFRNVCNRTGRRVEASNHHIIRPLIFPEFFKIGPDIILNLPEFVPIKS